ncbi:putative ferric-chelate reductase 1 isoform X2 [Trachemys scripta elegans]|uniref:putative ferric-chelate reductase 1 isoform X2 n=1 Tax=Trachemys scripta elegans TaxID=31138 RepID=UPI0015561B11|nr:putative ferric-chelate reductase 1 isoform X2 [Trachemys scripta elegans]
MTSFNNGIINCSFITRNPISTQSKAASNLYFIFLAQGPSSAGKIQKHPRTPFITPQKVNISSYEAVGGTSSTPSIIKAHGALMLIAWMTTGSIGMIFARYLKNAIGKTLLGKDIWFQDAEAHAVIGCIVMILSFFQPVIAFFRPSPQSKRRFIFNWFHALNAFVIKVLAVAVIFLGLQMLDSSPSRWMVKTMGGFVGWEALVYIMLDANAWLKKKEKYEDSHRKVKNEMVLFLIYTCGNLAFLIALLVGIGKS